MHSLCHGGGEKRNTLSDMVWHIDWPVSAGLRKLKFPKNRLLFASASMAPRCGPPQKDGQSPAPDRPPAHSGCQPAERWAGGRRRFYPRLAFALVSLALAAIWLNQLWPQGCPALTFILPAMAFLVVVNPHFLASPKSYRVGSRSDGLASDVVQEVSLGAEKVNWVKDHFSDRERAMRLF